MNKRIYLFGVIILSSVFFLGLTSKAQVTDSEVYNVYENALVLNGGRFLDPNLIQIGDTIYFPSHCGDGVEVYVAQTPLNGKHDSFWRLSERYVSKELETTTVDDFLVVDELSVPDASPKDLGITWWTVMSIVYVSLLMIVLGYIVRSFLKRPKNADDYPPVGGNADFLPREQSLNLLYTRFLLPGETILSFRKGTLSNNLGKKRFSVSMMFGDNIVREVWMKSGERVSTVIIEDAAGKARTIHLRNACFNGFGSGSFELPNGWFIQYDESEEAGRVVPQDEVKAEQAIVATPETPTPSPEPETPTSTNFAKLVEALEGIDVEKGQTIEIVFEESDKGVKFTLKSTPSS